MTNEGINIALSSLRPGAKWTLVGDTIEGLEWKDESITRPTDEEILSKVEELEV